MNHSGAQVSNRQGLLLVFGLVAFRQGFDVEGHGSLETFHACEDEHKPDKSTVGDFNYLCASETSLLRGI